MTRKAGIFLLSSFFYLINSALAQQTEVLQYHSIQTDKAGNIVSWFNAGRQLRLTIICTLFGTFGTICAATPLEKGGGVFMGAAEEWE